MAALLIVAMCFGLSGCTSSDPENTINVFNWGEYIDPDLLDQFEEETGIRVNYTTVSTCEEMYAKIRSGGVYTRSRVVGLHGLRMAEEGDAGGDRLGQRAERAVYRRGFPESGI